MKARGALKFIVIGLAVICLALPAPIFAQEEPLKAFKQEELDQLLAPIALYPDNVLTQILIASTYPIEVVQAERWVKSNKSLKGDAMKAALEKQTWDTSVKALVTFPVVLTMMSDKLDWTKKLGDAFLAQQKDVMDTVQRLRRKALESGNLKSTKEQELKKEGDIIIIQPANPEVVYVPTYNTTVVYGPWPYPAYPPYPVYVCPYGYYAYMCTMTVAVGPGWYGGWYHNNWHGEVIVVPPPPSRPETQPPPTESGSQPKPPEPGTQPPSTKPGTKPSDGGLKAEQWKHNPEHRQGVAYRDAATRDKYSPTNRAAVDNRMSYRGYDEKDVGVADRTSSKQLAQVQDRKSDRWGSEAKSMDNAFGGIDRGTQVKQDSARGHQSLSSAQRSGGLGSRSGSGLSRGGGGGRGRR